MMANGDGGAKLGLFNRWALTYDWTLPSVFYQAIHQRLLEYVDLSLTESVSGSSDGPMVIDVGCGTGKLLNRLAQRYPTLRGVGFDFSAQMLAQARRKSAAPERLTYLQGDTGAIELPSNHCDAAFCTISFLHYRDPERVLQEVHRILKPGGQFYLADFVPPAAIVACTQTDTLTLPAAAGDIRFYSAIARHHLSQSAQFTNITHHYLLGPVMLSVFEK
jgi:ubiquinone/menaquinone biosynthesis C-methylase UbiE